MSSLPVASTAAAIWQKQAGPALTAGAGRPRLLRRTERCAWQALQSMHLALSIAKLAGQHGPSQTAGMQRLQSSCIARGLSGIRHHQRPVWRSAKPEPITLSPGLPLLNVSVMFAFLHSQGHQLGLVTSFPDQRGRAWWFTGHCWMIHSQNCQARAHKQPGLSDASNQHLGLGFSPPSIPPLQQPSDRGSPLIHFSTD